MTNTNVPTTNAWTLFTTAAFVIAAAMQAGGIYFMDATFAGKGFYAMSTIMLVHTSITITKTLRDHEESTRLHNRLEEAKTEKLLMETSTNDYS